MSQATKDKPYYDLQATYARHPVGAPLTDTFIEILKFYFEPEEAHLAAHMGFEPEPEEAIARRAGMSLDEAAPLLTRMASRYFVRGFRRPDGVRTFRLHILALGAGLFEVSFDTREVSPDLEKLGDLWNKYLSEAALQAFHGSGISVCRALPAVSVHRENVLPYEDALQAIQNASLLTLNPCACRQAFRACDDPVDVCIGLSAAVPGGQEPGAPLLELSLAQTLVGRLTSVDEAVDALRRSEEAGLVHISMNHKDDPWFICNCCPHACGLLRGVTEAGITHAMAPSSYWTIVDEDMCSGCENCVERCPVGAIGMREDGVAEVTHEKCLGCGVCALVCGPGALTLEKRDDLIFTSYEDDRELFTLLAEKKGVTYPVHHHQAVIPG